MYGIERHTRYRSCYRLGGLSGIALFEEAFYHGLRAAMEVRQ